MMGAPTILFAKSLDASSTVLGIIAAFTPLMTVFQLPAARFLDRYGYRNFVLMGWGVRTGLIFLIAVVPMLGFLDNASKMVALLAALFVFNLLRGISSAAWMPWITELIPEHVRGRFLSLDQLFMYAGCLASLVASGVVMAGEVDPWEFSFVFLISAIGGSISLVFIKKIPEVASPETVKVSSTPVPWKAMLAYPPFLRIIGFNLTFMAVVGSLGVFTIEFLNGALGLTPSAVMLLSGFSFVGALITLPFCGGLVDQTGSKPLLRISIAIFWAVIAGWFLIAARVLPPSLVMIAALNLAAGAASAAFNLANVRIVMATMPEMGRNHFFALFTVLTSLGLGTSPIVWGLLLDLIGSFEVTTGIFVWRRHSFYFLGLCILAAVSFYAVNWLIETSSTPTPNLIYSRLRRFSRNWFR